MNYKSIISFLGSKQQKDWGTPIPEWINCKKSDSSCEWSDEFASEHGVRKGASHSFPFYVVVTSKGERLDFRVSGGTGPICDYRLWYCPEKDVTLILTQRAFEQYKTVDEIKSAIEKIDKEEIKKLCREAKSVML